MIPPNWSAGSPVRGGCALPNRRSALQFHGGVALAFFLLPALLLPVSAAEFSEDFEIDPASRGWKVFGNSSLFQWNETTRKLDVTWDSSRSNSYFHRPLGDILTRHDDFGLEFDLRLHSVIAGANPSKPSTFQIAAGFLHLATATNSAFVRATVPGTANLAEFNYFPAADIIDATVSPVIVSSNHQFIPAFAFPLEMNPGGQFRVALRYTASNQTLITTMTRDGVPFGPVPNVQLPPSFTDFRLDTFSVSSYSDFGDAEGSIYARGSVDNLVVTTPPAPVRSVAAEILNGTCRVSFLGRTNWNYTLLRSDDFQQWTTAQQLNQVTMTNLFMDDPLPLGERSFYRVLAERP